MVPKYGNLMVVFLSFLCGSHTYSLSPIKYSTKNSNKFNSLRKYTTLSGSKSPIQTKDISKTAVVLTQPTEPTEDEYQSHVFQTVALVGAAGGFAALISAFKDQASGIEFVSGYLLELCLSVDNLIVFILLFESFKIKPHQQDRILTYGIIGSIILRGIFIAAGAAAVGSFNQVLGVFALILFYSSYKMLFQAEEDGDEDVEDNAVVQFSKKYLKTTDQFDGDKFFTIENGIKVATPLFLCLVCVELSDILFAVDSVPAIFGVTTDPFIVYTSNIFAIMGLRSLFGVLSRLVDELEYLDKAVGVVLAVIAAKLGAEVVGIQLLSPLQSLAVVLSVLGTGVGASLWKRSKDAVVDTEPSVTNK